jgi:hypothetical protein
MALLSRPPFQNESRHDFADGVIAEDWVLVDSLGVFQQLGLVPPSEELLAQAAHDR